MPNKLTGSPLIIDTPGPGVLRTGKLDVYLIRWVIWAASPAGQAAGQAAVIQDQHGNEKWSSVASGPNHVEADHLGPEATWQGLIVPTLSIGKLYIYTS